MMVSRLGAFQQSTLGGFIESPLGARGDRLRTEGDIFAATVVVIDEAQPIYHPGDQLFTFALEAYNTFFFEQVDKRIFHGFAVCEVLGGGVPPGKSLIVPDSYGLDQFGRPVPNPLATDPRAKHVFPNGLVTRRMFPRLTVPRSGMLAGNFQEFKQGIRGAYGLAIQDSLSRLGVPDGAADKTSSGIIGIIMDDSNSMSAFNANNFAIQRAFLEVVTELQSGHGDPTAEFPGFRTYALEWPNLNRQDDLINFPLSNPARNEEWVAAGVFELKRGASILSPTPP